MNRSDRRNYELHRAVVARLRKQPAMVLGVALRNIERYRQSSGDHPDLREWEQLLVAGPDAVVVALLDEGERGQRLRSSTPFAGVISPQERRDVLARLEKEPPIGSRR
jgi:hypothetical protein